MGNRDPRGSYGALVKFRLASLVLLAVATLFYALPASNGTPIRVPLAIADRGPSGGDGVHDRPDNGEPGRRPRARHDDNGSGASGRDAAADPRGLSSSGFHSNDLSSPGVSGAPLGHAGDPDLPAAALHRPDPDAALMAHDRMAAGIAGAGAQAPNSGMLKNLRLQGHGERLLPGATTDVWVLDNYAYIGTFNTPCGDGTGENGSGIRIFDVSDPSGPAEVANIPSVVGSRSNDVKVAEMNSGDILVHSNESCSGRPGGLEIWNVDDPTNAVHLAHVQTDDINAFLRDAFGLSDVGVHNLFLFRQDKRDFVAAVVKSRFGNFQVFDITDPMNPSLVGFWGAEELRLTELGFAPSIVPDLDADDVDLILELSSWLLDGFGASRNRFLHDITINREGDRAYLSNWDAGIVLLDISDPTAPMPISVALDLEADGDMEVNSHAAWPSEDGSVVVETNEDFAPSELSFEIEGLGEFPAVEGAFTTPIASLPARQMTGPTTYVGFACNPGTAPGFDDPVPAGAVIAVAQRGACRFDEKSQNIINAGYQGLVVFTDAAPGDTLVIMGGDRRSIPGLFVGRSTGLAIFGVDSASDLSIGDAGARVSATAVANGWGGARIWDYSDEQHPVLVSTFDTTCSAFPDDPSCDPRGTYTAHNVIVEGDKAFLSWYSNGVLVLDISDSSNPVEIARFNPTGEDFKESNGGIQDVWGIFKPKRVDLTFASDRNGGLYILKLNGGERP